MGRGVEVRQVGSTDLERSQPDNDAEREEHEGDEEPEDAPD